LLTFLLLSMLATVGFAAALAYVVALRYSNYVHDRDLEEDVRSVAKMLQDAHSTGTLSEQVKFLIEYDTAGRNYFTIESRHHGRVSGSAQPISNGSNVLVHGDAVLYDARVGSLPVRAISLTLPSPGEPSDVLTVTVAETLQDRQESAREILLLIVPVQLLLIAVLLVLVWHGVRFGLRILDPLTNRLAARDRELEPISDADVPVEILPLTRTIDGLFARLRSLVELHERFIADAAHQLRTPLAGLSLHAERAVNASRPEERDASLAYVQELAARVARISSQLLALTLAEAPLTDTESLTAVDMTGLIPEILGQHIQQALNDGVDLGFDGAGGPLMISGNPNSLREMVDNLVDNAILYAARGGTVTVGLRSTASGDVCVSVDDDGPGVPQSLLHRLGERFFRAQGAIAGGTGLGLAIVQRIAKRHGARVVFSASGLGGLRVEIHFPNRNSR
jgi:two-component system sensor histidine kinase TctE